MIAVATCALCGSVRWRTRESIDRFRVVQCECGLVFVTPQPDTAVLIGAYDDTYYEGWREQSGARTRLWERRLRVVAAATSGRGRLLDLGCATGDFLVAARDAGWQVQGTEFSPAGARAAAARGLDVTAGEVWDAALPTASFDAITAWHVLEHARDPRRVLEECRRLLRPGGALILAVPNVDERFFRLAYRLARGRPERLFDPGDREVHLFHFSARTLAALVESAGFAVRRVGFDHGAAIVGPKLWVNRVAAAWFRLSGVNWGLGLELVAERS
jgi:SAM-dependent methyltransferase